MKRFFLGAAALLTALVTLGGCGKTEVSESESGSSSQVSENSAEEREENSSSEPATPAETEPGTPAPTEEDFENINDIGSEYVEYFFRTEKQLNQHFEKHGGEFGGEFGYETAEDYELGASDVINDPDALFKLEAEDGDGVYYIEDTNEFVILSEDGYIRTYFRPTAGKDYFDRQ